MHKTVDKRKARLPFNLISGVVVKDVLLIVWQDKNLVRFLTTAHAYGSDDVGEVERRRPRPYNSFLKDLVTRI